MGSSYSPRIAQSFAWAAVLNNIEYTVKGKPKGGSATLDAAGSALAREELKDYESPRRYVIVRHKKEPEKPVGILFIWYDNVIALTTSQPVRQALAAHLKATTQVLNILWVKTGEVSHLNTKLEKVAKLNPDEDNCSAVGILAQMPKTKVGETYTVTVSKPDGSNVQSKIVPLTNRQQYKHLGPLYYDTNQHYKIP